MTAQCDNSTEGRETSLFIQTDSRDMCSAVFSRVSSLDCREHEAYILKKESIHIRGISCIVRLFVYVCVYI